MEENTIYSLTPNSSSQPPKPPKKKTDFKRVGRTITVVAIVLILVICASTCFYTVDVKQQAVVTTFG